MLNAKRQERIQEIMRIVGEQGNASTIYLAKSLDVSESSIRRDINFIVSSEKFRNARRVYGGIVLEDDSEGHELMFELKLALNHDLKASIAAAAAGFIEDGDHIIIDSGTTCLCLAGRLHDKGQLQVITLDIKIAEELGKHSNIESNIIGGVVRPGYYTVGGIRALENLDSFSAGKVFMSVDAIDIEHGIANATEFEVGVKRRLLQMASHVYVLADHEKIARHALYRVAPISSVHTIITDSQLEPEKAAAIRALNIELVLAE